jgi:hypothetical protein
MDQFLAVLGALGIDADLGRAERSVGEIGWDAVGTIEGVVVVVEIKANPTVGDVARLASQDSGGAYKVLVARQIWKPVREALDEFGIGRFDGRGRLRLWHRPLLVDVDVDPLPTITSSGRPRLESSSALDVALAVLDGTTRSGVRATAAAIARSPGTVSKQLAALRTAHLVDAVGHPLVPALFEAVAEVWRPIRLPLADLPRPGTGRVNERLGIALDDPDTPGWVLADVRAAAAWGAPVVVATAAAPDFYVPDSVTMARARALLGEASFGHHACTVAVAPAPSVCRRRFDRSQTAGEVFLAPSPIVAALDLASDPARGREVLDLWSRDLPAELTRVW